ncbi:hypothetical protein [Micromonospora maritima]|uniref:hypothetical protein n=1 Tax=Micromonospora maritima TaxID=986711 RepID=UPI00157E0DDE|nr:hypothetical protein [Micromonospora maritima]
MFVHLREQQEHGEKCTADRCADGCGFLGLDRWLSAPLTAADRAEEERLRAREQAIRAGDI